MTLKARIQCLLLALSMLGGGAALAEEAPAPPLLPRVTVVDGFLVVHLPEEDATVIAQPVASKEPTTEDRGWASWSQRGELVWRGQMHDSQGRLYNVRILPGYVVPWEEAKEGWSDAGSNLSEYADGKTWRRLGHDSKDCFRWGWKKSFWEFGLKRSCNAWIEGFQRAQKRTARRSFGWPLAYPWALVSASFETLLRVPLGLSGAVLGTAVGGVLVPVGYTVWPSVKATSNIVFRGVGLPICAWTWQTVTALPASALASAPSPSRADGLWMKVVDRKREPAAAAQVAEPLSKPALETLARYAGELARLDSEERQRMQELTRRQEAELKAVRERFAPEFSAAREARARRLQAWIEEPGNRDAILEVAKEGGDPASIRRARSELINRLVAGGFPEQDAQRIIDRLAAHPLARKAPPAPLRDKTDPVKGALETVDKVIR